MEEKTKNSFWITLIKSTSKIKTLMGMLSTLSVITLLSLFYIYNPTDEYRYFIILGLIPIPILALIIAYKHNNKKTEIINTDNKNSIDINNETLSDFLQTLDYSKIQEINILAHTGRNTLSICKNSIDDYKRKHSDKNIDNLKINLLLKDPLMETSSRYEQIMYSLKINVTDLEKYNIKVNVRYYSTLPTFHGIICKNNDQFKCFISFYNWENGKSRNYNKAFILDNEKNDNSLINITLSWFEHLFGKKYIHTIIFDFDDTIVNSFDAQIEAWVQTLQAINTNKNYTKEKLQLASDLESIITDTDKLKEKIKQIFLTTYTTQQRYTILFKDDNYVDIAKIEEKRFSIRQELTKEAKFFQDIEKTLISLSSNYNLAIISATTENNIINNLEKNNLIKYFSTILGSNNSKYEWNIENKATLILKLSNLIGVPTSRMIFIGDSTTDYEACQTIKLPFIEASMIASYNNKDTLIKYSNNETIRSFKSYEDDKLLKIINNIEDESLTNQRRGTRYPSEFFSHSSL
jgi:phosphoglycolate phosphatase-like HAD superfamily hydrolase